MFNPSRGQSSAVELIIIIPVIIAVILVIALALPNYLYPAGSEVNTYQLTTMAQSLLDYIITSPGNPPNWGLNATQITSFGLAQPNEPYHLDPFKVLALVYWEYENGLVPPGSLQGYCPVSAISGSGFQQYLSNEGISAISISNWLITPYSHTPWGLNYTEVKELLGLGNNYEFQLIIMPLFNVSIINFPPGPGVNPFTVYFRVINQETGQPAANATVTLTYFATDQASNDLACQYGLTTPCTPAPLGTELPPQGTFTILSTSPLILEGTEVNVTDINGTVEFTLPLSFDGDNSYFFITYVESGGLGDYAYFQYPPQSTPLLLAAILPNGTSMNSVVFADPHLFTNCLINAGVVSNPGATALGLRIVAVFKSVYGYVFQSINFTINPGRGSKSYPVPCTYLSTLNNPSYSACYWNLPSTPMLLIAYVVRNSQGQAGNTPTSQVLVIPYGIWPEYYLSNRVIIFGETVKNAPMASSSAVVNIGDSAYIITLRLYYRGNVYAPTG
ncbi:hypothetical protein [Vulcanisaeta thermophila]|uniref:hypothetical protein n=1 Tax=Vulcanisaeta thermophila TaxID=867917 RepID=UPI0008534576|nr:hypothetical protein [Vulcanisaeta thermophila]